jgi:peptide/nickel transport system substrate-binding protein
LQRLALNAELSTGPVRDYWPQLREDAFDMYLLGWSPGTFDMEHPIRFSDCRHQILKRNSDHGTLVAIRTNALMRYCPGIQQEIRPSCTSGYG